MKKKLRIGIIDLVSKGPTKALWARLMYPNLASIMPQVLGVWCEEEGHNVAFVCYTGFEDLIEELPKDTDLVFIGTFTQSAQTAYSLSNLLRSKGILTAIGGPHARCYPQDAQKYFDYVLGFTDKDMIQQETRLDIADNSGVKAALCIKVLGKGGSRGKATRPVAAVGDIVCVAIKKSLPTCP